MELKLGQTTVELTAITYLPVLGLVLRVAADVAAADLSRLNAELRELLSHSPSVIWRSCCDSEPAVGNEEHADDCPTFGRIALDANKLTRSKGKRGRTTA